MLKVAILGFGTVGSSVARILCDLQPAGVELTYIFNRNVGRKKVDWVPASVKWSECFDEVLGSGVDVVLELAGGRTYAAEWVRAALSAGKSEVTANKQLIAHEGPELEALAAQHGGHLYYGAAVAGGIPVIPGIVHGLAGDRMDRLEGILNGTCNFILSKMEAGEDYAPVLKEAQSLGYAEANPTEDVDGLDARAKLSILLRLALGAEVNPEEIAARTITDIAAIDFEYARDLHCTVRQIARAEQTEAGLAAVVGPMLVPLSSPLAWSRGTENMVIAKGHYGGQVVFSGHGAGGHPTAVAVVSDLLAVVNGSHNGNRPAEKTSVQAEGKSQHYIRFLVKDKPGIVAEIAGALAAEHINIDAILQKPGHPHDRLPFVVTVEPCTASALKKSLARIEQADFLLGKPVELQILERA